MHLPRRAPLFFSPPAAVGRALERESVTSHPMAAASVSSSVQDELKAWAQLSDEKPYEKKAEPNHPGSAADFLKSFEKSPVHPEPAAHTQPEGPSAASFLKSFRAMTNSIAPS